MFQVVWCGTHHDHPATSALQTGTFVHTRPAREQALNIRMISPPHHLDPLAPAEDDMIFMMKISVNKTSTQPERVQHAIFFFATK